MTFEEWKTAHEKEIAEMVRVTTSRSLYYLYDTFYSAAFKDGFDAGVEETEERLLGEREEEL